MSTDMFFFRNICLQPDTSGRETAGGGRKPSGVSGRQRPPDAGVRASLRWVPRAGIAPGRAFPDDGWASAASCSRPEALHKHFGYAEDAVSERRSPSVPVIPFRESAHSSRRYYRFPGLGGCSHLPAFRKLNSVTTFVIVEIKSSKVRELLSRQCCKCCPGFLFTYIDSIDEARIKCGMNDHVYIQFLFCQEEYWKVNAYHDLLTLRWRSCFLFNCDDGSARLGIQFNICIGLVFKCIVKGRKTGCIHFYEVERCDDAAVIIMFRVKYRPVVNEHKCEDHA